MKNAVQCTTHLGMSLTYFFTIYYAVNHLHIPMMNEMFKDFDPGQYKYLTVWNVILQALFFLLCLMNDIFGTNAVSPKKRPLIRKVKDYVHATLSFPVSMFVGVTFWGLMFVDRELVLPKAVDPYFPSWLNHLMHTLIMVSTVMEMVMAPRAYPTRSQGLTGLGGFMLVYLIWMHVVYFKSGVWAYPIMEVLSFPLRMGFFVILLSFCMVLYVVGEKLDSALWRKEAQLKKPHAKSK